MLNGHVDTKPVGDSLPLWESNPLSPEIRGGRLYGLGSSDMKAAVAAMVFAAAAVIESGEQLAGDLMLAFVADEEAGAELGSKFVAPHLSDFSACLIGEPSGWQDDWQGLHLVSRGVCCFRIRVRGTQMHSSLSDRMPSVNASRQMAELLLSLDDELELQFTPHPLGGVTPTSMWACWSRAASTSGSYRAWPSSGAICAHCRYDRGWSPRESGAMAEKHRATDPELDAEVIFEPGLTWVPPAEIDRAHPLVGAAQSAAREVLGASPPLSSFRAERMRPG